MKNDFRHYCLVSLFSLDEIDAVKLVNNDLSDNQVLRAEQLLKNNGKLFVLTHSERIIKTFEVSGLTKHHITLIQSVSDCNLED